MAGAIKNPGPGGGLTKDDPLFKNWVRAALGLNYLKSGLESFVSTQVSQRYTTLRQQVFQQCPLVQPCSVCTLNNLLPDHAANGLRCRKHNCFCTQRHCNRRKCPNNFCSVFYDLVVTEHVVNSPRSWSDVGVDISAWYHDVFQYTKCYLGSHSKTVSINDLDCTGLLTVIINNCHIHQSINNITLFKKCREARNAIFHKAITTLTDQEINDYIDDMINALEDRTTLINDQTAKACVTDLYKLKNDQITITDGDTVELMEKRINALGEDIEKLGVQQGQDRKKRKREFEQVSQEIKKLKVAICTIKQASTNEGISDEDVLNGLVNIYKADCCSLPVSALYEADADEMELLSIYKPPSLYYVPYHRTQGNERKQKYPLSSYKEIFCKDDQSFRKIYITGDAGVGKTSFCKRMSLLWAKSKSGESVSDVKVQGDIDFMSQFDFAFHLSLGETHRKDIVTMIVEQLFWCENDKKKDAIYATVEKILAQNNCVIIMDALDEWSPRESGKININRLFSDKCTFITTCRPYKLENERLSVQDIDRHVQMTGIDRKSTDHYVRDIVNCINTANGETKDPDDFMKDVKNSSLSTQLHIPIIASHLVAVWFDHELTNMSRALIYSNIVNMLLERAEKMKHLQSTISEESTVQLPESLTQLFYLNKHTALLKKICFLSFNLLFKQDKGLLDLVFTREQLGSKPYYVSVQEMDFFCKFGILSKNKVIGRFGKREQKLSYVHKTYIEFFAALFVSSFDSTNAFENVVQNWNSADDVVQFAAFFRFFVGFSFEKGKAVFDDIYHSISDDLSLCRRNSVFHHDRGLYLEKLKSFQTMIVHCFKESKQSNSPNISFKLEDLIFDDYDDDDTSDDDYDDDSDGVTWNSDDNGSKSDNNDDDNSSLNKNNTSSYGNDPSSSGNDPSSNGNDPSSDEDDPSSDEAEQDSSTLVVLKQLLLLNRACVKAIYSDLGEYHDEFDQVQGLQYFYLGDPFIECIGNTNDYKKFKKLMVLNNSTLHTVNIRGDDSLISEIPVGSLHHLTSLHLEDFKLQHNSLRSLVNYLSNNVLMEDVELSKIYCVQHQRDIDSDCDVDSDSGSGKDSDSDDSSDNQIDSSDDKDSDDSKDDSSDDHIDDDYDDNSNCMWTLNLTNHTKLTTLGLQKVNIVCNEVNTTSLKTVSLKPLSENIASHYTDFFESIKDTQLEGLNISGCKKVTLSDDSKKSLTTLVKTLPCIKFLDLRRINLHDNVLQLHPDVTQVHISLDHVTLSQHCFESLIESVVSNRFVIKFDLHDCLILSVDGDAHRKLSWEESMKCILEYLALKASIKITRKVVSWLKFETSGCQ